ncbi:hypothetical protein [Enterococcus sp. 5H]|uniref:hypothetical protein n=1 Tax=Enterococcus sp. 5H TaxID=1229490 RepID=UPI0023032903|nr:hypothetical protein [Enterococcus sp. 5H]MDA9472089.1 hypothetical protein [Enterococcus sp. 5H]
MTQFTSLFDEQFLEYIRKQQKLFAPVSERYEAINKALEPNRIALKTLSEKYRPYIDYANSMTELFEKAPSPLSGYVINDSNEYDTEQIKSDIISLEDRLSNLAKEPDLSERDQKLLKDALIFIGNQSSEDIQKSSDNYFAATNPDTDIKDTGEDKWKYKFNETSNSKDKEQAVDKIPNSNPSFVEKLLSKETFQEEAISFIHQYIYNLVVLVSIGKLDPLFLAVLVTVLLKILIPKNDK